MDRTPRLLIGAVMETLARWSLGYSLDTCGWIGGGSKGGIRGVVVGVKSDSGSYLIKTLCSSLTTLIAKPRVQRGDGVVGFGAVVMDGEAIGAKLVTVCGMGVICCSGSSVWLNNGPY